MSGGYFQFQSPQLRVIPIRVPTTEIHSQIKKFVEKLTILLQEGASFDDYQVKTIYECLNDLFLSVYDLTQKEQEALLSDELD